MVTVEPGTLIRVRDVKGELLPRIALSGVEVDGHDFPIVWACTEREWEAATAENREPEGIPWPAEDVLVATGPVE